MSNISKHYFGFLPINKTIEFTGGILKLLDGSVERWAAIQEYANKDGYFYPPSMISKYIFDGKNHKAGDEAPNSRRPGPYHPPLSHELLIYHPVSTDDGYFLIKLAAYFFGYQLQFYDQWFDRRINIKSNHNIYYFEGMGIEEKFLSDAYLKWMSWPYEIQKRITNCCNMISRTTSYELPSEEFSETYKTFDACYKIAHLLFGLNAKRHNMRFHELCNYFGMYEDISVIVQICNIRHELFHEGLWDNNKHTLNCKIYLRHFTQRLIAAIFGVNNDYVKSNWARIINAGHWD